MLTMNAVYHRIGECNRPVRYGKIFLVEKRARYRTAFEVCAEIQSKRRVFARSVFHYSVLTGCKFNLFVSVKNGYIKSNFNAVAFACIEFNDERKRFIEHIFRNIIGKISEYKRIRKKICNFGYIDIVYFDGLQRRISRPRILKHI